MLRSTVRYTCTKHKVIYVETENRNDGNNHCWQDSFLLPTWHQILFHFRNELFSQNMGKRFQAGNRQPLHSCRSNSKLGAIGITQYFPVSFLPPHMQEQSCIYPGCFPTRDAWVQRYICHYRLWLCCSRVGYVCVLVFATGLHSMLLLVSFHSRETEHGTGKWRIIDSTHHTLCPGERN